MNFKEMFKSLFEVNENTKGTYAGLKYTADTEKLIKDFVTRYDIPNPNYDIHTTILYSTKECPNYVPDENPELGEIKFKKFTYFGSALVIELDAPLLVARHKQLMKEHDAVYDFDKYIPHITISYDCNVDISKLQSSYFNFNFVPLTEYKEDLDMEKYK